MDVCQCSTQGSNLFGKHELYEWINIDSNISYYVQEKTIRGYILHRFKSNLAEIINKLPGFVIDINHGEMKLDYYMTALIWLMNPEKSRCYQDFRDKLKGEIINITF